MSIVDVAYGVWLAIMISMALVFLFALADYLFEWLRRKLDD